MKFYRGLLPAVVFCAVLSGLTVQPSYAQDQKPSHSLTGYVLGPDDVIDMIVYEEPDLSKNYRVGSSGSISVPLIGEVKVGGLTLQQAEAAVMQKLSDGYLVDPSVAMQIVEARPFYIMGEVKNPGSYKFASNLTALSAVAVAGGFTYRAREGRLTLTREGEKIDITPDTPIFPGDVITVHERFF